MRTDATWPMMAVLAGASGAAVAQPNFLGLGDLPGGVFQSEAFGISPDGRVVVGASVGGAGADACYWTWDDGLVSIGDLPGGERVALANAASMGGAVVVGYSRVAIQHEAFRWTAQSGMVGMGGSDSSAWDVSWDGEVVVGITDGQEGREAFRWTEATGMVSLGYLSEERWAWAFRCSADGSTVVGVAARAALHTYEPFRWTASTGMVGLGVLPGGLHQGYARAVSGDGSVVVGWSESAAGTQAFAWDEARGMRGLGDFAGGLYDSRAYAVSGDGSVVFGTGHDENGPHAFVWDQAHGMRKLADVLAGYGAPVGGWQLWTVTDVSDDGRTVVGWGFNPCGSREGFVAPLRSGCYADCDTGGPTVLDIFDFLCFQNKFAAGHSYADCDKSTGCGVFDVFDSLCFQNAFAAGCP